jgi:hypothetical protein
MRGRHGSVAHCAHRRPKFTCDRSEARGHGAAHAALPPGWLRAGCACWCAPDGFAGFATAAWPTARTDGQTLPVTAPKHAGMALRTLRYLPGGCAQGARAGAPDGFSAQQRRGGTQGAATPEGERGRGPPPAWSLLMGLLRPHRAVAPAPRAPTDARGDHARAYPRILADESTGVPKVFLIYENTDFGTFPDHLAQNGQPCVLEEGACTQRG